jgi:hypothetical protein
MNISYNLLDRLIKFKLNIRKPYQLKKVVYQYSQEKYLDAVL